MMTLRQLIERYLALGGTFGRPVPLSAFGWPSAEIESLFSSYDQDYHISRFFHFTAESGTSYRIDNQPATHISIDPEINSIL
jgi:hypothetical protein